MLIAIIFSNFLKFDFLIFLLAAANVLFCVKTAAYAKKLFRILNPSSFLPGGERSIEETRAAFQVSKKKAGENQIIYLRRKTGLYHTMYENITMIFPLLGLLGTVVSLLPMAGSIGETPVGLFYGALTSTFWGIVFAILFKGVNGYLASMIDDNEKNVDVYLARNTKRLEQTSKTKSAEQTEVTAKSGSAEWPGETAKSTSAEWPGETVKSTSAGWPEETTKSVSAERRGKSVKAVSVEQSVEARQNDSAKRQTGLLESEKVGIREVGG